MPPEKLLCIDEEDSPSRAGPAATGSAPDYPNSPHKYKNKIRLAYS
jgi:hypothetical protein